jgi:hypothetical protein
MSGLALGSATQPQVSTRKLQFGFNIGLWRSRQQVLLVDAGSFRMGESSSWQRQVADSIPARYTMAMELQLSSALTLELAFYGICAIFSGVWYPIL